MARARRTQNERSEAMRTALLASARKIFGRAGFHAASVTEIAAAASATKGALYHHFADKDALFEAVARRAAEELTEAGRRGSRSIPHSDWAWAKSALEFHLKAVAESPEIQRILLVDGMAVLGPVRWRRLMEEVMIQETTGFLAMQQAAGKLPEGKPDVMARLVLAALNEAALFIAESNDHEQAREAATVALLALVGGLAPKAPDRPGG